MVLSFSFLELGQDAISTGRGWFTTVVIRSAVVNSVLGGWARLETQCPFDRRIWSAMSNHKHAVWHKHVDHRPETLGGCILVQPVVAISSGPRAWPPNHRQGVRTFMTHCIHFLFWPVKEHQVARQRACELIWSTSCWALTVWRQLAALSQLADLTLCYTHGFPTCCLTGTGSGKHLIGAVPLD